MNPEIKRTIISKLKDLPVYHESDDGCEHTVRCPYCGDSKTFSHAHLGIRIDPNDTNGMPWNCFRCGASGVVTDQFLEDLGIVIDEQEVRDLRNFNKKLDKISQKKGIVKTENYTVPTPTESQSNVYKLMYLNQRLGTDFHLEDLPSMKIIPSINEFMVHNDLKRVGYGADKIADDWMIRQFERDYIGFLSANNNLLTLRNVNPNSKGLRYFKVFANPLNTENASFYSIPTRLDLLYTDPLNVHIAEGTFDILSVKFNVIPSQFYPGNHIYYAACGYSYVNILKYLIRAGICTHITVHIYADNDKKDVEHIAFLKKNQIHVFIDHAYIHRNRYQHEKDFGVDRDHIYHVARKIW